MTLQEVKIAGQEDENAIIDVLKLAFAGDPVSRWIWPSPQKYLSSVEDFARAYGGKAFSNKTAYFVGDYSGAALWLPNGVEPDFDTMMAILQATSSKEAQTDGPEVFEKMGGFHPTEPHWYLPLLGVDPFYHGKGLGTALMGYATDIFDKENIVAYLESSNEKNITLYKRHGFESLGIVQVNTSPTIYPMMRKPRTR
ncbi:MAG TPA: GNAT family N-acetyltransferase [Nitrososphaeraceae archaeon]